MRRYAGIGIQLNAPARHRDLLDTALEHDACGVAFVARIAGGRSHSVIESGIEALVNLGHRGASGAVSADSCDANILACAAAAAANGCQAP